jgi:hypothetical protein
MDLRDIIVRTLRPFGNRERYQPEKKERYQPEKREKLQPEKRRKYPRIMIDLPLEYWTEDNPHTRRGGIARNASQLGFLIHSIENMRIGTRLKIALFYAWGYELTNLETFAEVIWKSVEKEKGMYLYGLKFIGIYKEDSHKLEGLLAATVRQPPTQPGAESSKFRKV